jgi:hypothetical protein
MRNLKHSQLKHTNNLSLPQAQYHDMKPSQKKDSRLCDYAGIKQFEKEQRPDLTRIIFCVCVGEGIVEIKVH